MVLTASWQDAGPRSSRATGGKARRRQAFAAARRHSRLVRVLRILLPVLGAAAIIGFVVLTRFSLPGELDLSSARLSVTRNSIIMDHPRLTGFDADGREYSVEADRAIQALTNPNQVRLEVISAKIVTISHGATTISAAFGEYDHGKSTLSLEGDIAVDSAEGYALRMEDAEIDFRNGTMISPNPVTVGYQDSEITGRELSVTDGGKVLVFEGGVRTLLMPPRRPPATSAPEPE